MNTKWVGRQTVRMETVDSTNEEMKRYASQGAGSGALIVAERQTAGKGRRGRSWESREGDSLLMSALLRPDILPEQSAMLTIVTALAVCQGIERIREEVSVQVPKSKEEAALTAPQIKWPNDIILGTRKVCGILVEMMLEQTGCFYVVIGIGVNVNNQEFSGELSGKATSLQREWGYPVDREELMLRIWQEFDPLYDRFLQDGDLRGLQRAYEARLVNSNRQVQVFFPGGEQKGTAKGIDSRGRLLLKQDSGETLLIDAGEVSVRGICGYV